MAERIPWRAGPAPIARLNQAELADTILLLAQRPDARHVVAQFDRPVGPTLNRRAREDGLKLLGYLGSNAFFASVAGGDIDAERLSALPSLTGIQGIQRAWKLDPRILAGETPTWAVVARDAGGTTVAVYVLFHPDVPLFDEARDAAVRHGADVLSELESINGMVVELPAANIDALADEDAVQWIEWPLPRMSEVNDSNRQLTEADVVQASPYNLSGAGVTVLVYDAGTARASHVDFQGRLSVHDASGMHSHATHVAGTIGGAGIADPTYRGMAPGVSLLSYGYEYTNPVVILYNQPGDLEDDYDEAINVYGADIANNSIGSNVETNDFDCTIQGNYGVTSALIDSIVSGSLGDPFRIVWAAGNERQNDRCDIEGFGDYYSTAPPAGAKNPIVIGATNSNDDSMTSFSSWGPVDDGRLKPDIVAPGCQTDDDGGVTSCSSGSDTAYSVKCGTSMAAPTVTGLAALLIEDFRTQFPSRPDPQNSTLKALFAHNAEDIENVGPDFKTGYGSVRIQRTIDFMRTGKFVEGQVDQAGRYTALVEVNASDPELKVTLAWDDVPGTPNIRPALVNDLDLRVFDASSQQFYPWTLDPQNPGALAVRTLPDHLNNMEQVLVDDPAPGVWRIEVFGFSVAQGPQTFSLCVSAPIIPCSSQAIAALDAPAYGCDSTAAEVQVIDCDPNADDDTLDWLTVTVSSDSEPGGETLLLTETAPDSSDFRGTIPLRTTDYAGVLLVGDGDTMTATYIDADDGTGHQNIPVIGSAVIDCTGPVISNVQLAGIDVDRAIITFETDEWATGTVHIGPSCGAITGSFSEPGTRSSHMVLLTELTDDMEYYFVVDALDQLGNPSRDNNGGVCYSFFTRAIVFDFPLDADPGFSTEGEWAFGQPTGGGSLNGDPTAGYTGDNVYGYNLSGDYTNDLPARYLITTALDLSPRTDTELRFRRWLVVEPATYDYAAVQVSNDGTNWTTVWDNVDQIILEAYWTLQAYDISAVADGQPEVYVRWVMGPTNGIIAFPGWNIDNIQIIANGLPPTPTCDDGIQNQDEDRIDCGGPCPPCDCLSDAQCNDPLFCNGTEFCNAFGNCQTGTAVDCADGVGCTVDTCNEQTDSCDNVLNNALCDNGLYCDGAETCHPVMDCQDGNTVDCDDGVDCTVDACNEETDACINTPDHEFCRNDLYCDGIETCDPLLDCRTGTAVDCGDGVSCTVDTCNEQTDSCDNVPSDALCSNNLFCDGVETCHPVLDCQEGTAVDCHDGVDCTEDSCNESADSCNNVPNDAFCGNGLFCDGAETCHPILDCQDGTPVDCADGVNCTVDSCNEFSDSCDNVPNDVFCDNGFFCDGEEACDPALDCQMGDSPCPPEKLCREFDDQCVDCLVDADCTDGDPCNGIEKCKVDGTCFGRLSADCNENASEDFCDIDDGTSLDCQPNGIPDECDLVDCADAPTCDDCNANNIPDFCDIAAGTSPDVNGNGVPDECDVVPPAPQPGPPCGDPGDCTGAYDGADCAGGMCYLPKNRYLSLDPTVIPVPVAYQLELIESAPYPAAVGRTWWVDAPMCYDYPNGDVVVPTPTTCAGPDRFAWVAKVTPAPVTRVWNETPVHVTGCPVVPEASYLIRASHDSGVSFSDPLLINTAHNPEGQAQSWGDLTGGPVPGMPGQWLPPERSMNFADVGNAIRTFENYTDDTGSPPRVWVDMEINQVINLADVQFVVNAFQGTAYIELQLELIGINPADCP